LAVPSSLRPIRLTSDNSPDITTPQPNSAPASVSSQPKYTRATQNGTCATPTAA
jgi:hypothetical protein